MMSQYILIFVNTVGAMAVCTILYGMMQRRIQSALLRRAGIGLALGCGGILIIDPYGKSNARFTVPYINGKLLIPLRLRVSAGLLWRYDHATIIKLIEDVNGATAARTHEGYYAVFRHQIPYLVFIVACVAIAVVTFRKSLSLLPVLGLLTNLYLMTQLGINNWTMFFIWLLIGLGIYFGYGHKHSKLNREVGVGARG